jgi:HPt (histidine-containing phosphotransfer) domain-containing protein
MTHATHSLNSDLLIAPSAKAPERAAPLRKQTSMKIVFLLVGIAIVVFMAFTASGIFKEIEGRAQLAAIKDVHFPVLQRLDANTVRIDKIEALFIEVAVTGDSELIERATAIGTEADQAYREIGKLNPRRDQQVAQLRDDLKKYQELATEASLAFINTEGADTASMDAMNAALESARRNLAGFRASSYAGFVDTLSSTQNNARTRLMMGLALGVMNLGFMAVLVYFIRNNIRMMAVIAEQNRTLEQRVTERTAQLSQKTSDINAMLQNMQLGVCTVVTGNRIHPEYSRHLETIFGAGGLGGKDVSESLFRQSTLGVDAKDQMAVALGSIVGEDAMMFDLNGHLLPREMQIALDDGARKTLQLEWSPIVNPETNLIDKVLLIAQDVTHLRELERSSAHQKEELEIVSRIIRVPVGKFNEVMQSAQRYLAENRRVLMQATDRDQCDVSALFRNMHTVKGNARTYEFTHITNAAHQAEQSYDRLRKDQQAEWRPDQLLAELATVEAAISLYNRVNEETLGRNGRASDLFTDRGMFVSHEQITSVRSICDSLSARYTDPQMTDLRNAVDKLGMVTLTRLVSSSLDAMSSLANELKKPMPAVDISNGEVAFNVRFSEALKSSLMHIIRNCLDHGIESPEERARASKPKQGTLRFACERKNSSIELRISDDGRGLALHKLHEKAAAAGLFDKERTPTPQELAEVVFRSGLTTAEQVTQVSGRGVGMEAVRTFLKEQNATIAIALKDAGDKPGYTPFEFVISVPPAAMTYAA